MESSMANRWEHKPSIVFNIAGMMRTLTTTSELVFWWLSPSFWSSVCWPFQMVRERIGGGAITITITLGFSFKLNQLMKLQIF